MKQTINIDINYSTDCKQWIIYICGPMNLIDNMIAKEEIIGMFYNIYFYFKR